MLILDEPTNHIDAETVAWLETYLAGTPGALVMVTHDRYFLDRAVTRIVELDRRRLVSYPGNYSQYLRLHAERQTQLAEAEQKRQNLLRRELEWLRRADGARHEAEGAQAAPRSCCNCATTPAKRPSQSRWHHGGWANRRLPPPG